jgi:hypothetical protein
MLFISCRCRGCVLILQGNPNVDMLDMFSWGKVLSRGSLAMYDSLTLLLTTTTGYVVRQLLMQGVHADYSRQSQCGHARYVQLGQGFFQARVVTNHSLFTVCSCFCACSWIVFLVVTDAVVAVIVVVITQGGVYRPNPTSKNTVQQLVMQ